MITGFFIGRNTERDASRPYRFVPVRHVPSYPDLFQYYGQGILNAFDSLPTWTIGSE